MFASPNSWILVFWGLFVFRSIGCRGCPLPPDTECQCEVNDQNQRIINCRREQLQKVPEFTNTSEPVYELTLYGCMITELPANAFSVLNVERIDLGENPITTIHQDAFNGIGDTLTDLILHVDRFSPPDFPSTALAKLPLLKTLHVSKFDMPTLPTDALTSLSSLVELSITESKLEEISSNDFSSQQNSLEILHLESNAIHQFPTEALGVLSALKKLDFTLNEITGDIPTNAFINNAQLQEIDLSNNQIYPIREGAFIGITNTLKTLHMRSNKLTRFDLDKIGTLGVLEDLDLSYNGDLTAIGDGAFSNMHQLKKLNLHGCYIGNLAEGSFRGIKDSLLILQLAENRITSIGPGTFSGFTKLQDLYLDHQSLENVLGTNTFSGLESVLRELSLEGTGFSTKNWPAVKSLASLTKLKLKNNQIDSVPDFALQKLTQVQTLDISFNTLMEVTQLSLTGPQNSLNSIELGTNVLTTLNECSFYGFTQLKHIGLKDNPLHCDCKLKWLRLWVDINYDDIEKDILFWKCNTPDKHNNKRFVMVTVQELEDECATTPSPIQCEVFTSTTSSTTTSSTITQPSTTESTTTDRIPNPTIHPLVVNISDVTDTTGKVHWDTENIHGIEGFEIDVTLKDSNTAVSSHKTDKYDRDFLLQGLDVATDYKVCVTMWILFGGVSEAEIGCVDFSTKNRGSPIVQAKSNTSIILGAVLGVLAVIVVLVIVIILVLKCRRRSISGVFADWTKKGGTKSGPPGQARLGMPTMGDNSKRFSKDKHTSHEIHSQNIANRNLEHFKNYNLEPSYRHIDLQRDLERFNPEERERILNMLTHSGGSHLSTISVGQRYVPEPPPRPPGIGDGYLDPQPLDADAGYEQPHVYVEIDDQPQISKECYI